MNHSLARIATVLALLPAAAWAQVGIGTSTPNANAALEISATDKGLLIPRLTIAQRTTIISPPQGLMVYQTDGTAGGGPQTGFWYYAGTDGWVFLDAGTSSGLTLPYAGTAATSSTAFAVSNTGNGQALSGTATGNGTAAVRGENTNTTSGSSMGVLGVAISGYGVRGTASGTNGYGVAGEATNSRGVSGTSASGVGVYGTSSNNALTSAAIVGANTNAGSAATGVLGTSAAGYGVRGEAKGSGGYGVQGEATDGHGLDGIATTGAAVVGAAASGTGVVGSSDTGVGVQGTTSNNSISTGAIVGNNTNSGSAAVGILGLTASGYGVRGVASANGGWGVAGSAVDTYGVVGQSTSGTGVWGQAASSTVTVAGVVGENSGTSGVGVRGSAKIGVRAESIGTNGIGLYATASGAFGQGVFAQSTGGAVALEGNSTAAGLAGRFSKSGTSSGAVVQISQASSTSDLALDVIGGAIRTPEVNSANTGGANLLPLAYGRIRADGVILSGSGNFSVDVSLPGTGYYAITLSAPANVNLTNAICVASGTSSAAFTGQGVVMATASGGANSLVEINTWVLAGSGGTSQPQRDFSFVVYRP